MPCSARYRDVIGCTVQIGEMAKRCDRAIGSLSAMQERLFSLAALAATSRPGSVLSPRADKGKDRSAQMYAIGSRVKYLLDTPEASGPTGTATHARQEEDSYFPPVLTLYQAIWGHLDAAELLLAAVRLSRAFLVHARLEDPRAAPHATAHFPLVRSQWPQIAKLRDEVEERARQVLNGSGHLTAQAAAEALAALVLVTKAFQSEAALQALLEARAARLERSLSVPVAEQLDASAAAELLAEGAGMVQDTLALVWSLFHSGDQPGRLPSLFQRPSGSAGLAGEEEDIWSWDELPPLPGAEQAGIAPESALWAAKLEAAAAAVAPADQRLLQSACTSWLDRSSR